MVALVVCEHGELEMIVGWGSGARLRLTRGERRLEERNRNFRTLGSRRSRAVARSTDFAAIGATGRSPAALLQSTVSSCTCRG